MRRPRSRQHFQCQARPWSEVPLLLPPGFVKEGKGERDLLGQTGGGGGDDAGCTPGWLGGNNIVRTEIWVTLPPLPQDLSLPIKDRREGRQRQGTDARTQWVSWNETSQASHREKRGDQEKRRERRERESSCIRPAWLPSMSLLMSISMPFVDHDERVNEMERGSQVHVKESTSNYMLSLPLFCCYYYHQHHWMWFLWFIERMSSLPVFLSLTKWLSLGLFCLSFPE